MLNDIGDAVTRKLDELFPDFHIYTGAVEQGLTEPCFFVAFLEPSEKALTGRRYYRQTSMSIQYLPGAVADVSRELNRAADILMEGLEYVTMADGSLLRGTNRSVRPDSAEEVLTFLVDYNMFVVRQKEPEARMDGIETKVEKEGRKNVADRK